MSNAKTATEKYVDDAIAAAGGGGGGGTNSVAWEKVTGKPTFSTVATSGSYNDLADKPTIPAPVDISGKADKSEVEAALALKADADALPYALVTPGEWTFSGSGYDPDSTYRLTETEESGGIFSYALYIDDLAPSVVESQERLMSVVFDVDNITATRASLPGHLADRAVNAVAISAATTQTLPAANPGHSRDLYVRLTVSATSAVTWAVAQGESWDAMGAPPSSFAAGTYLYRITEVAAGVWHCEDMLALVGLESALAAINGGVAP